MKLFLFYFYVAVVVVVVVVFCFFLGGGGAVVLLWEGATSPILGTFIFRLKKTFVRSSKP